MVQPLALPSPALHSLKADATPQLEHHDVAISFCYEDANTVSVNQCGERFKSTCTGSNGLGECCSSTGKCGSDEKACGEGMQEEFSHSKNLCEEGQARDGFEAPQQDEQAAPQEQQAVYDPVKNAADLKDLMDAACDFDAQGCNKEGVCQACYTHFEGCRGLYAAALLPRNSALPWCSSRTLWPLAQPGHSPPSDPRLTLLLTLPRPTPDMDKEAMLDDCMDKVAKDVAECSSCNSDKSKA